MRNIFWRNTMINIAVCDDEEKVRIQLNQYITEYIKKNNLILHQTFYENGKKLLDSDLSNTDILLLDIQLGEMNGLEIAKQIRKTNKEMMIIFITNFAQYAIEGYEVKAFHFLKKPITYERFQEVMDDATSEILSLKTDSITIKNASGVHKIFIRDIMYCETYKGHVLIQLKNRETIESYSSMGTMEKLLCEKNFFRCHTAFLINFYFVKSLLQKDVILEDNTLVPISKYRKKLLLSSITNYWGDKFL